MTGSVIMQLVAMMEGIAVYRRQTVHYVTKIGQMDSLDLGLVHVLRLEKILARERVYLEIDLFVKPEPLTL